MIINHSTWVPLALELRADTPWVDWGDLGGRAFTDPFLSDTISNWLTETPEPQIFRTTLDALRILDNLPSLDPQGFIFHLPRSGSTLLCNLLRQITGCVVVSEPEIINNILLLESELVERTTLIDLLRLTIRALSRRRRGDEESYIVKLSSWNVRKAKLFFEAFPNTNTVWLQRRPQALQSISVDRPSWVSLRNSRSQLVKLFGKKAATLRGLDDLRFCACVIEQLLETAARVQRFDNRVLDYTELPDAAWTSVASTFGLSLSDADVSQMRYVAKLDSKSHDKRIFTPRPMPTSQDLISRQIKAVYHVLLVGESYDQTL
jgi:hypothetical protein